MQNIGWFCNNKHQSAINICQFPPSPRVLYAFALCAFKTSLELNSGAGGAHQSSPACLEDYEVFHRPLQQTIPASVQETAPRLLDRMAVVPTLFGALPLSARMLLLPPHS